MFKIGIAAAYLSTPINDDVKHKRLMLDKDVVAKTCLRLLKKGRY